MTDSAFMGSCPQYINFSWRVMLTRNKGVRTTAILKQVRDNKNGMNGAQRRNRTTDTRIFNPLLYRLSYLGNGEVLNGFWQTKSIIFLLPACVRLFSEQSRHRTDAIGRFQVHFSAETGLCYNQPQATSSTFQFIALVLAWKNHPFLLRCFGEPCQFACLSPPCWLVLYCGYGPQQNCYCGAGQTGLHLRS